MPNAAEVIIIGTDSSGRTIYATRYMADWWERVVADLGFRPTIVQGAWMVRNGGGADASAGYHDGGGCFDLRTWDLTVDRLEQTVRTLRRFGAGAWRRDNEHGGMDPHLHFVLGSDYGLAAGAASQWRSYIAGHDGLVGNGPDYEWRMSPLVTTPPPEDDMADYAAQLDRIEAAAEAAADSAKEAAASAERARAGSYKRDKKLIELARSTSDDVDTLVRKADKS